MDRQRRDWLRKSITESVPSPRTADWAEAVCSVIVAVVSGVDAAALTLRTEAHAEELVGASEPWAAELEEAQYTLGEGPGVEAFTTGGPVLVADVREDQVRWPAFASPPKRGKTSSKVCLIRGHTAGRGK